MFKENISELHICYLYVNVDKCTECMVTILEIKPCSAEPEYMYTV